MIYETDFQKQIESAFLTYGASVAQERAIPDVRDGLKIGLRQGLYAQFTHKHTHKDKMTKAAKSVADAMGQSYVHGDIAMYETFIRAARPWSYRYTLEETQGNAGDPTAPDSQGAMRYIEMRSSELADILFVGLKKNAINEWYWNYDDTEQIPSVFPSIGYWNIVNGCSGIAVTMATSVPQFNLKEVNEALIKIIQNPNISFDEIYCAPDFASGGTIINSAAIKESLKNGKGESIRLRAKLEYNPDKNMICASELPYGVFTNIVIKQLAELVNNDENYGIENVVDHTKKTADIRIYLTKGANPKKMIDKLYKDTSLENWFSVNMIMLHEGRFPRVFGWREACDAYISHIRICERNIIQFDLNKALARKNIVEGLIKAYSIIDEVIATIKSSNSPAEAAIILQTKFNFNEEQAKAILAMKLSSLTKLDIIKLNEEREELDEKIKWFNYLLNDSIALDNELIKILQEVADKFGDSRRTKVLDLVETNEIEEIKEENVEVLIFNNSIIRIIPKENHKNKIKMPKGTELTNTLYTTNLSSLITITDAGRLYHITLADLDYNKDYSVSNLVNAEKPLLIIDTTSFNAYQTLITVSKNGYIKRSLIQEYNTHTRKGAAAVKLEDSDSLISIFLSNNDNDRVLIVSNIGNYTYYKVKEISTTGRVTKGVRAIKADKIQASIIIKNDIDYKGILVVEKNGLKRTLELNKLIETSRAIKGQKLIDGDLLSISTI